MSHDRRQPFRDAWEQCIRADPRMTGSTLLVALVAASHGNRDGTCIMTSVKTLADECGLSVTTVKRALSALRPKSGAGYLERVERGTGSRNPDIVKSSSYSLAVPDDLRLTGEPKIPVDNTLTRAHARAIDARTTAHPALNYSSSGTELGLTHEPLPVVTRDTRRQRRPAWCGQCDQTTRQIEVGEDLRAQRCPRCHPLRSATA